METVNRLTEELLTISLKLKEAEFKQHTSNQVKAS